ncbi:MAG: hypothetical protein JSS70_06425 [Bacteroidetes bacterium]|nr:hypothetical protein [Bacteroidota bacterium]
MNKNNTLKRFCIIFFFAAVALPVFSQDNAGMYPKNIRVGVAAQGFVAYPGRLGASLDGKLMLRGNRNNDIYNEIVITAKAAHAFANNAGNVFSAFDKGKYDNISSLFLLAGYRINFGLPVPYSKNIDAIGGAFLEFNAGITYVHHIDEYYLAQVFEENQPVTAAKLRTWAPAISGVAGYTVSKKLDVILSYTGAWPVHSTGKVQQSFIGAGLQYNF